MQPVEQFGCRSSTVGLCKEAEYYKDTNEVLWLLAAPRFETNPWLQNSRSYSGSSCG